MDKSQKGNLASLSSLELLIEYSSLRQPNHTPSGLYVSISSQSNKVWQGLLFLHSGPYVGAIFKFTLLFEDYPRSCPKVIFDSDVWHPLVSRRGQFSTNSSFPEWTGSGNVSQLLFHLKAAFKESSLSKLTKQDCVNKDCFDAYHRSKELWTNLARQCAKVSISKPVLYNEEEHDDRAVRCISEVDVSYEDMIIGIKRYLRGKGQV